MKVLIAFDSFKDSLTAKEAGENLAKGLRDCMPDIVIDILPLADGGEGTVRSLTDATSGNIISCTVHDALMRKTDSFYGILGDGTTAVIEMAAASGIEKLATAERNPWLTSSYGTGELIMSALNRGCRKFIIGIGGSATNDAGIGMAQAMGIRFYDTNQREIPIGASGKDLGNIEKIDFQNKDRRIEDSEFVVACDVNNPLVGKNGASYIYGPQKGADKKMVKALDDNLRSFSNVLLKQSGTDLKGIPGGGAAGGLGAGLIAFNNAELKNGFDIISHETKLSDACSKADIIITGEGKMDNQTLNGKTPFGVAKIAKTFNKPVIGIAGTLGQGYKKLYDNGFDTICSIINQPMTLQEALFKAPQLMQETGLLIGKILSLDFKN